MSSACHATIPLPAEQKSVLNTPSAIASCVTNFETENRLERFFAGPKQARKKRHQGKSSACYVLRKVKLVCAQCEVVLVEILTCKTTSQIYGVLKKSTTKLDFIKFKAWEIFFQTNQMVHDSEPYQTAEHKSRNPEVNPRASRKTFIKKSVNSSDIIVDSKKRIVRRIVFRINPAAGRAPSIGQPLFHRCC